MDASHFRDFLYHGENDSLDEKDAASAALDELRLSPLISWSVMKVLEQEQKHLNHIGPAFPQFGLLGNEVPDDPSSDIDPVFLNTDAPWSAFICGSQGSGKSHTLSCMLENCLLAKSNIGQLPSPLAGLVFHFDNMAQDGVAQVAYLCTQVKTRVLVSPSNLTSMRRRYMALPNASNSLVVEPLYLLGKYLNTSRIMRLMAVNMGDDPPLYVQVVTKVLREMASISQGVVEFDWSQFKVQLDNQGLLDRQKAVLQMRLDLVESFMDKSQTGKRKGIRRAPHTADILAGEPGVLTIVDLSDPMVDSDSACVLFDICLALFVERTKVGKVIALDEAHNYMYTNSDAAAAFTATILKNVREQRHKAVRAIVSTQEPTVSPSLLDLCTMTIVHRFTSPEWYHTIKKHLAGVQLAEDDASDNHPFLNGAKGTKARGNSVLKQIVRLRVGESLLFCPTAALALSPDGTSVKKLFEGYVKFRTRPRITADGGRSKLATGARDKVVNELEKLNLS